SDRLGFASSRKPNAQFYPKQEVKTGVCEDCRVVGSSYEVIGDLRHSLRQRPNIKIMRQRHRLPEGGVDSGGGPEIRLRGRPVCEGDRDDVEVDADSRLELADTERDREI